MRPLPFTAEQFFEVFAAYNSSVWPWQFVLALTAATVAIGAWRRPEMGGRTVPAFLAMLWLWSGLAYHLAQFTRINPAAYAFAGLFVLQALLWAWAAARPQLRFASPGGSSWTIGAIGIVYALVVYPLVGRALGHGYLQAPTFGAPCPSVIFTFGILLWARPPVPMRLLVIPFLWAVLAAPAALGWGVLEDAGMPLIAVTAVVLLGFRNRKGRRADRTLMASGAPAFSSSLRERASAANQH
jgi:hypothetical protein